MLGHDGQVSETGSSSPGLNSNCPGRGVSTTPHPFLHGWDPRTEAMGALTELGATT